MCKANGSHPNGSCLSQSLGAGEHSGAGGDDIVHQQDAFACDLLFIQNAVDTLQIGAPFCCAQGVLGSGSGSLFQKLLTGQMQLFGKLLRNQLPDCSLVFVCALCAWQLRRANPALLPIRQDRGAVPSKWQKRALTAAGFET